IRDYKVTGVQTCALPIYGERSAFLRTGVVLGLGLLTKAFFLTAVPAVAIVMGWAAWKRPALRRWALGAFGMTAAIAAWWYIRNIRLTGSLSGVIQDEALHQLPVAERLRRATEVHWLSAADSTFFSHIWFGGWSFLQVRAWIY